MANPINPTNKVKENITMNDSVISENGIIIPTPDNNDYVDGEASEGFIRGYWDMRYLQTLIDRNNDHGDQQSQDFVDIINTNTPATGRVSGRR